MMGGRSDRSLSRADDVLGLGMRQACRIWGPLDLDGGTRDRALALRRFQGR